MTRFKSLRKAKGLSQTQLANELNVDQTAVSKWELGKSFPDMGTAIKLAAFYNVTTDYLLGLSDDPEKQTPDTPKEASDDDIKFALFGGEDEITDEMYDDVKRYAEFIAKKKKQQREGK